MIYGTKMFSQMLSNSACFFQRNEKKIHYLLKPTMNFKLFKIFDPLHQYAIDHFFVLLKSQSMNFSCIICHYMRLLELNGSQDNSNQQKLARKQNWQNREEKKKLAKN